MSLHKEAAIYVVRSPAMSPSSESECNADKPNDLETVALTEQHKQKQVFVNIFVRRITGARKKVSHCLVVLQSVQCRVLAATKISIIVLSKLIAPCLPNNVKHLEKCE